MRESPLTGNLVVGQSGGPTAVINSSLAGVIDEASRHANITGVFGMLNGIEGLLADSLVDLGREGKDTIAALRSTPAAALGSCRYKLRPHDLATALRILIAHGIRFFVYIGGNDSADTSHRLQLMARDSGYDLRVIGVPKTIDNDLPITDHCPGYGSIARFVASATMDAGRDTEALCRVDPVKIIEVMGRNAGWVAAASALGKHTQADPPHLIYFPERPLAVDRFLQDVKTTYERLGRVIVVTTETVRDQDGVPLASRQSQAVVDGFGHQRLTGAAQNLCHLIEDRLGLKSRWDKPGTIQRMAVAYQSPVDEREAYGVGRRAVLAAVSGRTDVMVILRRNKGDRYGCSYGLASLEAIANSERLLPDDFINAEGNFVTPAFIEYAKPLIGPPLPSHARLLKIPLGSNPEPSGG